MRLASLTLALLSASAVVFAGCGDEGSKTPPGPSPAAGAGAGAVPAGSVAPAGSSAADAWKAFSASRDALLEAGDAEAPAVQRLEAAAKGARAGWSSKTADDALALARFSDAFAEPAEKKARLLEAAKDAGEAGRAATTWLLSIALEEHDPAAALPWLDRIVQAFGGKGTDERGRPADASVLAGALVDEAAAAARRLAEGPAPDLEGARRALAAGRTALVRADLSPDDRAPLDAAAAYLSLSDSPFDLGAYVAGAPAGKEPRIVVFADHFQLLEPVLPSVLKRWARGLPVAVVGILAGRIRAGIRRVDARPAEERAAIAARVHELGLALAGTTGSASDAVVRLGLLPAGATVFVVGADGTILARAAGNGLDARVLDPVVTRLAPTTAPEPDVPPR